jgi:asparagine synthase (glutamine-hydrolysing)
MGFPVPLSEWMQGDLKDYLQDVFHGKNAHQREYLNPAFNIKEIIKSEGKFTRKVWGLLSLELWQQEFHDNAQDFKGLLNNN